MKLNRKLATTAIALTATMAGIGATATSASAMAGYEDTFKQTKSNGVTTTVDVGVNYNGARSLDVKAVVSDAPQDSYCTIVLARLRDRSGNQLGQIITVGSVCGGKTLALPLKSISTQAGDIDSVEVWATLGVGGSPTNVYDRCYRGADTHWGSLDSCA